MNELGKMDMIQFEDLQRDKLAAHKSFAKNVHRCEEMKIRVDRLMEISEVNGWPLTYCEDHPKFFKAFTTFLNNPADEWAQEIKDTQWASIHQVPKLGQNKVLERTVMEKIDEQIEDTEKRLEFQISQRDEILESIQHAKEQKEILKVVLDLVETTNYPM